MHFDIACEWALALNSKTYPKGQRGLLREQFPESLLPKFSAFGVLCNIHAQKHPAIAQLEPNPNIYMGEDSVLPESVADWAGISDRLYGYFYSDKKVRVDKWEGLVKKIWYIDPMSQISSEPFLTVQKGFTYSITHLEKLLQFEQLAGVIVDNWRNI